MKIRGLELKVEGKIISSQKFEGYKQSFENMLKKFETWVSVKMEKKKEKNYKYEDLEAYDTALVEEPDTMESLRKTFEGS